MLALLFALSVITFLLFTVLPADPARLTCGKACTPAVVEANRERLGLNDPIQTQYWEYVSGIVVGRTYGSGTATFDCSAPCLGYSFREGEEVTDIIVQALPVTISVAFGAFILWMVGGIGIGIFAALRRGKWQDKTAMGLALAGYSFPSFFIGLVMLYLVVILPPKAGFVILPYPDYAPLNESPTQWVQALILPWITLAMLYAAFYARLTRNQMLETLGEDYIRTARSKGLSERRVIYQHALRAGITPIVTAAGLDLAFLLGGAIIVEQVFTLPGLGRVTIDAVSDSDLPIVIGTVLITSFFVLVGNLVIDVLYAAIDPRVRLT